MQIPQGKNLLSLQLPSQECPAVTLGLNQKLKAPSLTIFHACPALPEDHKAFVMGAKGKLRFLYPLRGRQENAACPWGHKPLAQGDSFGLKTPQGWKNAFPVFKTTPGVGECDKNPP